MWVPGIEPGSAGGEVSALCSAAIFSAVSDVALFVHSTLTCQGQAPARLCSLLLYSQWQGSGTSVDDHQLRKDNENEAHIHNLTLFRHEEK